MQILSAFFTVVVGILSFSLGMAAVVCVVVLQAVVFGLVRGGGAFLDFLRRFLSRRQKVP